VKWFNGYSTKELKQSQKDFTQALQSAIECANLLLEMNTLQLEYQQLLGQKIELSHMEVETNKTKE